MRQIALFHGVAKGYALGMQRILTLVLFGVGPYRQTPDAAGPPSPTETAIPPSASGVSPQTSGKALAAMPSGCAGVHLTVSPTVKEGFQVFGGVLTNDGGTPVILVEPGDGSAAGWRTPILTWQVTTMDGVPAPLEAQPRCGNMNEIRDSEIFTLAPGERHPISWIEPPPVRPGRYNVRLVYQNDPAKVHLRPGTASASTLAMIGSSTACTVTSPEFTVTIDQR